MRCNLNNDGGEFIGFYGDKGTMIIKGSTLTFSPQNTLPEMEGYSTHGWPLALRKEYRRTGRQSILCLRRSRPS